jgi:ketosteroid isomerase-like protein
MSAPTPTPTAETETVRQFYAALNRGDIPAMVATFDPQVAWNHSWDPPDVTYKGLKAVETLISNSRAQWADGACEPERFIAAGDKIVVLVHVRVRLKHETEWREGRLGDVYTFRDGKIIDGRSFLDRQQALEWAGVESGSGG